MNSEDSAQNRNTCAACPLAQIPAKVWLNLLKPPFRKRHPFIFWICVLLVLGIGTAIIKSVISDKPVSGECIALVNIQGPILEAGPTLAWIRKIEKNPEVKGILCRVNSPGGGAAASQEIYAALEKFRQKRPVVVSMGATAASGGLMISMAGNKIYANPSTVTGSIGVRMDIPQLQGLMEKIGVGQETLVTAPYKDAASYTHPLTPKDREYLQSVLFNMHEQFVDIIAKGRTMPKEEASALANGKIYTGQEALALKLIDELGGQEDAHAWICAQTGVDPDKKLLVKPTKKGMVTDLILGSLQLLGLEFAGLREALMEISQPLFLYQ